MSHFDVQAIKAAHPLLERCAAMGIHLDTSGTAPCPRQCCSNRRTFYITKSDLWACRNCHPEHGDVIELHRWLHQVSFTEACKSLQGNTVQRQVTLSPEIAEQKAPDLVPSTKLLRPPEQWILGCESSMYKMRRALAEDYGCDCTDQREYLASRGISLKTALAFGVGAYHSLPLADGRAIEGAKCIAFPHTDSLGCLTAIKYRLLNPRETAHGPQRFLMHAGSKPSLFKDPFIWSWEQELLLVAVEGETNALSIAEVRGEEPWSVLSFGGESSYFHLRKRLDGYPKVLLWLDDAAKCEKALARLGSERIIPMCSPNGLDANDLLVRHGPETLRELVKAKFKTWPK